MRGLEPGMKIGDRQHIEWVDDDERSLVINDKGRLMFNLLISRQGNHFQVHTVRQVEDLDEAKRMAKTLKRMGIKL